MTTGMLSDAEEALVQLCAATSPAAHVAAVRMIKNHLTGHEVRKIEYIQAGLIIQLSTVLSRYSKDEENDNSISSPAQPEQEVAIWSNAASVVSVLANNGTAFTEPILDSNLIEQFLNEIRARSDESVKLTCNILRCLNNIADNLPLATETEWMQDQRLMKLLYTKENMAALVRILAANSPTMQLAQAKEEVLQLICKTCYTEVHRDILTSSNVFDVLSGQLAWSIANEEHNDTRAVLPRTIKLSLLLEAFALLVERSKSHADRLVDHEGINLVLTHLNQKTLVFDQILPIVPDTRSWQAVRRSPFPPLAYSSASPRQRTSSIRHDPNSTVLEDDSDEDAEEGLIVPYLLCLVRKKRGRIRMMAAKLLGLLKHHNIVQDIRARSFAVLLVPILVDMIDTRRDVDLQSTECAELVPSILALVVRDKEHLQDAAVEAKAIVKLAAALKANFESMHDLEAGLWWPQQRHRRTTDGHPGYCLGPGGPSKEIRLRMQYREGLLQALAALAPTKDAYRKDICDNGALTQIILALEPFYSSKIHGTDGDMIAVYGNSSETLVAACAAVRALTRSVTALRTKLVDAEVAKSILRLLQITEPEVRIAATMVVANLAHDFSPMKGSIGEYHVIHKLCEQAHSANARLRHESLFALKALVNNSPIRLKKQVVDELGPNWIKLLLATDPHDVPAGEVIGLVPRDYRKGSMVRISVEFQSEDTTMDLDTPVDPGWTRRTLSQDLDIQAEMFAFLRNLTTGENPTEVIDYLLEHIGEEDILQILTDRMQAPFRKPPRNTTILYLPRETIVEHAVFIAVHLCAADRKYRALVSQSTILMRQVALLLSHDNPKIRSACCWLIINLVYHTSDTFETVVSRARELHRLGIVTKIKELEKKDNVMDVKERAKTASECFGKLLDRS